MIFFIGIFFCLSCGVSQIDSLHLPKHQARKSSLRKPELFSFMVDLKFSKATSKAGTGGK
jgi:hypothetical protein